MCKCSDGGAGKRRRLRWYCPQCYTRKSIRAGSFFEKSLQKLVLLMYMWVRQYPVKDASEEAEVTEHTAIDMYQWLREVCSHTLVIGPLIILGGQQTIVQIDERLFRHKPKVSEKIKIKIKLICPIALSWESNHKGSVGIWVGRYIPYTSSGIYGVSAEAGCSYPASHYYRPHCTRHNNTL